MTKILAKDFIDMVNLIERVKCRICGLEATRGYFVPGERMEYYCDAHVPSGSVPLEDLIDAGGGAS